MIPIPQMPKQPHKSRRIASVPMSKKMKVALEKIAKAEGTSFGAIVRRALEQAFNMEADWETENQKYDPKRDYTPKHKN
jgi:Ribonuclease G/E